MARVVDPVWIPLSDGCGLAADPKGPLFRTIGRGRGELTSTPLPQPDAYAMIRRRALAAGIKTERFGPN